MDERQRLAAIAYIRSVLENADPDDPDEANAELFALYRHMREMDPVAAASLFRDAIGPHWEIPWEKFLSAVGVPVPDEDLGIDWSFLDYDAYRDNLISEFERYFDEDEEERAQEVVDEILGSEVFIDPVIKINWEQTVDSLFDALGQFQQMGPQNITAMASHEIPHLDVMQDEYAQRVERSLRRYRDAMLEAGVEPSELQELQEALDLYGAESLITKIEMAQVGLGFLADGIVMDLSEQMLERDMRGAIAHETSDQKGTVSIWLGPGFAALFQEVMSGYDFGAMTDQNAFWQFDLEDVIYALRWAPRIFGTRIPDVEVTVEPPEMRNVEREAYTAVYNQGLYHNFDNPNAFLQEAQRIRALPGETTGTRMMPGRYADLRQHLQRPRRRVIERLDLELLNPVRETPHFPYNEQTAETAMLALPLDEARRCAYLAVQMVVPRIPRILQVRVRPQPRPAPRSAGHPTWFWDRLHDLWSQVTRQDHVDEEGWIHLRDEAARAAEYAAEVRLMAEDPRDQADSSSAYFAARALEHFADGVANTSPAALRERLSTGARVMFGFAGAAAASSWSYEDIHDQHNHDAVDDRLFAFWSQWWSRCKASMGVLRDDRPAEEIERLFVGRRCYYRARCPRPLTSGTRRSGRDSMNVEEAYRYAMARLDELREAGVVIESIAPRSVREGGERLDELITKYGPPDRLPHHLWRHVTLRPTNREQVQLVRSVRDELGRMGIGFDSGGAPGAGALDWEFDWSFHVNADTQQMEARRHVVDELIDLIGNAG